MPLVVVQPRERRVEREYVLETLLRGYLGVDFVWNDACENTTRLEFNDGSGRKALVLPDVLLATGKENWLKEDSLPRCPLLIWEVARDLPEACCVEPGLPVVYGTPVRGMEWIVQEEHRLELGLDVLGSAFFMLTRYEELVKPDRDEHGRFPARESLAGRAGLLGRPMVDEYAEVLWACMKRLWPGMQRRERGYKLLLTHDVDSPFSYLNLGRSGLLRASAGDLAIRRAPGVGFRRMVTALSPSRVQPVLDPNNSFGWMMGQAERRGVHSAFFFSAGGDSEYDPVYSLEDHAVRSLIRRIAGRGHEVGFHGSYGSMESAELTAAEVAKLRRVFEDLEVRQEVLGGRQHYLRWRPVTWRRWSEAGLDYDSSVGYRDMPGFRAGTTQEFQAFDLEAGRVLPIRERPLSAMDVTLFAQTGCWAGLDSDSVVGAVERLSGTARKVGGTFTLLWHNSSLLSRRQRAVYQECLDVCV